MDKSLLYFMSAHQLSDIMSISYKTAYNRLTEIEEEKQKGTYPDWVMIQDGKIVRCWFPAFLHYENERKWLRGPYRDKARPFTWKR
jgi:hypothetical protein